MTILELANAYGLYKALRTIDGTYLDFIIEDIGREFDSLKEEELHVIECDIISNLMNLEKMTVTDLLNWYEECIKSWSSSIAINYLNLKDNSTKLINIKVDSLKETIRQELQGRQQTWR